MRGKAFILALSLAAASGARAQWVVSDPASYTYYVEQLRQLTAQLETAKNQLDSMKQVQRDLTGMYNRARGLVDDLKKAEQEFRDLPGVIKRAGDSAGMPNDGGFEDIQKVIDKTFGDNRTRPSYEGADARHQVQQQALKGVIGESEKLLGGIADRMKKLQDLAGQIDGTANIKDAMDLNNRIAVEILRTLIEMLAVAAKANQAQALFNYSGTTDAGAQERERTLKDADRQMRSVDAAIKARLSGKSTGQPGEYARRLNW